MKIEENKAFVLLFEYAFILYVTYRISQKNYKNIICSKQKVEQSFIISLQLQPAWNTSVKDYF